MGLVYVEMHLQTIEEQVFEMIVYCSGISIIGRVLPSTV